MDKEAGDPVREKAMAKQGQQTKTLAKLLLLSHGLGVLLAFVLFYSFYRTQCSALLTSRKADYNSTIASLQTQCDFDSARIKDAFAETASKESLTRQLSQLEQQTALASKHQECLASHEAALVRLSTMQQEQETSRAEIHALNQEIQSIQQTIEQSAATIEETKRRAEKQQERLQNQLELAKIMVQEKVDEVERLKSSSDADTVGDLTSALQNQEEIVQMLAAVKRRSMALSVQSFGEAPYTVLFWIKGPNQAASSFEVEFGTVHEMPHTVYTFLTLVDAGLYHETTLQLQGDAVITGGSPSSSIRKQVQSKLMRKYAELGYGVKPLLFTERSTAPCGEYSFAMVNKGPDFEILLEADSEKYTCPGRVVSGQETLRQWQQGERTTIVDARIVQSTTPDDEL